MKIICQLVQPSWHFFQVRAPFGQESRGKEIDLQVFAFLLEAFIHRIVAGKYGLRDVAPVGFPYGVDLVDVVLSDVAGFTFDEDQLLLVVQQYVDLVFRMRVLLVCLEDDALPYFRRVFPLAAPVADLVGYQCFPPSPFKIELGGIPLVKA